MFKFQRIASGGKGFTDYLFIEDRKIGVIGQDEDGLYIRTNHSFTLNEVNILIAQLAIGNPNILDKTVEFLPFEAE